MFGTDGGGREVCVDDEPDDDFGGFRISIKDMALLVGVDPL